MRDEDEDEGFDMRTRREFGSLVFSGGSSGRGLSTGAFGGGSASVQRGTLAEDTWVADGRIRASILVDGDDEPGEYGVDLAMQQGQRVVILMFSSQAVVLPISSLILGQAASEAGGMIQDAKTELEAEIEQAGEQIKQDAVHEATASVDGKIEQGKDEIEQWVADTYQSKSDMGSYATTSDLEQTSESITATFTESLNTKGKTYVGKPSPPYSEGDVWIDPAEGVSYTCVSARESGSYQDSDWDEHDAFVSAFVRSDYDGVTVGKTESGWKARLSTRGTFDILDTSENAVAQFGRDSTRTYVTTVSGGIEMRDSMGAAVVSCKDQQVILSAAWGAYVQGGNSNLPSASSTSNRKLTGATLLYSNTSGTTGTVSLNDTLADYVFVEVYYRDASSRCGCQRVHQPNGKSAIIERAVYGSGVMYIATDVLTLSESTITRASANRGGANISNGSVDYVGSQSPLQLSITHVIGYSC